MITNAKCVERLKSSFFPRPKEAAELMTALFPGGKKSPFGLPVLFLNGQEGSGLNGLAGYSLPKRLGQFDLRGVTPTIVRISAPRFFSKDRDVIASVIRIIFDKHPLLKSDDETRVEELLSKEPELAGEELGEILQSLPEIPIVLLIQFEEMDQLFERICFEGDSEPDPTERDLLSLLEFLRGVAGQSSILLSFCTHTWASDQLIGFGARAGMSSDQIYSYDLTAASRKDFYDFVYLKLQKLAEKLPRTESAQWVGEDSDEEVDSEEIPEIGDMERLKQLVNRITDDVMLYPPSFRLFPDILDRIGEEAEDLEKPVCLLDYTAFEGLSGFYCARVDKVIEGLSKEEQLVAVFILQEISESRHQSVSIYNYRYDEMEWQVVWELVHHGVLNVVGDSIQDAVFRPAHSALFEKWEGNQVEVDEAKVRAVADRSWSLREARRLNEEGGGDTQSSSRSIFSAFRFGRKKVAR